ncbi:MAG: hypothetical protein BWY03_00083 [Parcubacteria group bacterium ADurb.Bin159]|nr:MAG: hypothetical protein BWY03_00083 [Parcubacteria group bacterium ADurb.Bin159]
MKTYKPLAGENISETARTIVAMAKKTKGIVRAKFNDIELTANPGDNADAIVKYYSAESNRRHEEYVNSPEYKERQRKADEAQRRHNLILEGALMTAPEKMTLRDEEGWKKIVAANTDGYGSAVIRFAERWARLMEGRIANGDTVEGCAEEASQLADNEGITGFVYSCAVSILSQVWIHGEQLRRWHNLKTQIGNEGEEAK